MNCNTTHYRANSSSVPGDPTFLHAWGAEGYGAWLVLATLPGALMGFADMGLPTAAANEMAMRASRGDRDGALAVFQSAWALVTAATLAALALGAALARALPLTDWLNLHALTPEAVRATLVLLMAGVLLSQQGHLAAAGLRAAGAFPLQAALGSLVLGVDLAVLLVLLAFGASPVGVAAGMVGVRVFGVVVAAVASRRKAPWLRWGWAHADRVVVRQLLRPGAAYLGIGVNEAMETQGVVAALGIALGPVAVAAFSTVRTLTGAAREILRLVNASVWPEVTAHYGAGRLVEARRFHRGAVAVAFWLGLAVLTALALAGPAAYRLWVGDAVAFDPVLFYTLLGAAFAGTVGFTSAVAHLAVNRHDRLAVVQTAAAVAVFAVAFFVAPRFGVAAVGAAFLAVEAATALWIVHRSLHLLGDHPRALLRAVFRPSLRRALLPVASQP